jgi:hypothetical protein
VDWTTQADVDEIESTTGALAGVETTVPVTGTGSSVGDALPAASQALVRWRTGQITAGRELRGRTFIPALVEASNDNGQLLAASRTMINTAAAALIADVNSGLVIYSRTHNAFHIVQTGTAWTDFAVMRSRRD